jgi:hypothetical protein
MRISQDPGKRLSRDAIEEYLKQCEAVNKRFKVENKIL